MFHSFSARRWCGWLKSLLMGDEGLFIIHGQYHGYWLTSAARELVEAVLPEYQTLNTRRINTCWNATDLSPYLRIIASYQFLSQVQISLCHGKRPSDEQKRIRRHRWQAAETLKHMFVCVAICIHDRDYFSIRCDVLSQDLIKFRDLWSSDRSAISRIA